MSEFFTAELECDLGGYFTVPLEVEYEIHEIHEDCWSWKNESHYTRQIGWEVEILNASLNGKIIELPDTAYKALHSQAEYDFENKLSAAQEAYY